ncbi:MAG: DUF3108 domain-containing protein [Calditrichaeota bacterium]|nr:DUF3108 domain-containing protein [Calditrichota bacterium]MCB9366557.1 DUF3108 domain-containing protein [Calditrichota bacterium]MCB9391185.1 DUF3108 domain-containing protein [Calditrichota bacterium]
MKFSQLWLAVILLFSVFTASRAGNEAGPPEDATFEARRDPVGPPTLALPFGIGEEMTYHVSFGAVPAGKAQLRVLDSALVNDQWSWVVQSSARSAKGFDWVFKVRDTITTWIDMDSIYTHRFYKKLLEGFFEDEKLVKFYPADGTVRWWDDGKERSMQTVEPYVQDVLSAGYRTRCLDFNVGDTVAIRTHDVNKTYDLLVIVHARDTVETLAGEFDCFVCEPVLKSGGLFQKERKAHVYVWVTADERRIPVIMSSKVSFGSFTVELEEYTPGNGHAGITEKELTKARDGGRPDLGVYSP